MGVEWYVASARSGPNAENNCRPRKPEAPRIRNCRSFGTIRSQPAPLTTDTRQLAEGRILSRVARSAYAALDGTQGNGEEAKGQRGTAVPGIQPPHQGPRRRAFGLDDELGVS